MQPRMLIWKGEDQWLSESTTVTEAGTWLHARGTQLGADPIPYRVDYELVTQRDWVTQRLSVTARGDGWTRSLELLHDGTGNWTCSTDRVGADELPEPGGDVDALTDALDCDLGRCPLTNTMPVRRHNLHRSPGERDFTMAWVSVPDLRVKAARQRYEHVRRDDAGAVVRYIGEHRAFVGELELDSDAFVLHYPALARRVGALTAPAR